MVLNFNRHCNSERLRPGSCPRLQKLLRSRRTRALLLHGTQTEDNGRQRNGGHTSGGDLNQAIGEHRPLLATAGLTVVNVVIKGTIRNGETLMDPTTATEAEWRP